MIDKAFIQGFQDLYPEGTEGETDGVNLIPKTAYSTSGDTMGTAVLYADSRRMPANRQWMTDAGISADAEAAEWQLWDVGSATIPEPDYTIKQVSNNREWVIKAVSRDLMGAMHTCLCVRKPAT